MKRRIGTLEQDLEQSLEAKNDLIQIMTSKNVLPSSHFAQNINEGASNSLQELLNAEMNGVTEMDMNESFKLEEKNRQIKPQFKKSRKKLPIFAYKSEILGSIRDNQVILVKGETGCGKKIGLKIYYIFLQIMKLNI